MANDDQNLVLTIVGKSGEESLAIAEIRLGPLLGESFGVQVNCGGKLANGARALVFRDNPDAKLGEVAPGLFLSRSANVGQFDLLGPSADLVRAMIRSGDTDYTSPRLPANWSHALINGAVARFASPQPIGRRRE